VADRLVGVLLPADGTPAPASSVASWLAQGLLRSHFAFMSPSAGYPRFFKDGGKLGIAQGEHWRQNHSWPILRYGVLCLTAVNSFRCPLTARPRA
jgi:hypothetical protein